VHQLPSVPAQCTTDFGQHNILTRKNKIYYLRRFRRCILTYFMTVIEINSKIPSRRKRQRDNSITFWPEYLNIFLTRIQYHIIIIIIMAGDGL